MRRTRETLLLIAVSLAAAGLALWIQLAAPKPIVVTYIPTPAGRPDPESRPPTLQGLRAGQLSTVRTAPDSARIQLTVLSKADGSPVPDARVGVLEIAGDAGVELILPMTGAVVAEATTDSSGQASLPAAGVGLFLHVRATRFVSALMPLPAGGSHTVALVPAEGEIRGLVLDQAGDPVIGATVACTSSNLSPTLAAAGLVDTDRNTATTALSDSTGRFRLSVPLGRYRLLPAAADSVALEPRGTLAALTRDGPTAEVELRLVGTRLVRVRLRDRVSGASIGFGPHELAVVGHEVFAPTNLRMQPGVIRGQDNWFAFPQEHASEIGVYSALARLSGLRTSEIPHQVRLAVNVPGYEPALVLVRVWTLQSLLSGKEFDEILLTPRQSTGAGQIVARVRHRRGSVAGRDVLWPGLDRLAVRGADFAGTTRGVRQGEETVVFEGIPAGQVEVRLEGDVTRADDWQRLDVPPGGRVDVDFDVEMSGILLDARDEGGGPVGEIRVGYAPTNVTGKLYGAPMAVGQIHIDPSTGRRQYEALPLRPGEYRVVVEMEGLDAELRTVQVRRGELELLEIQLRLKR